MHGCSECRVEASQHNPHDRLRKQDCHLSQAISGILGGDTGPQSPAANMISFNLTPL